MNTTFFSFFVCLYILDCLSNFGDLSFVQAFVDFFSRGLQEEYRRQGILIQVSRV